METATTTAVAHAATATLTHASTCNGGAVTTEPLYPSFSYTSTGIFGWKKRTLYFLLILLMSVVVINMALTFWIIKILDLTSEGLGRMVINDEGILVKSDTEFLGVLSAKEILVKDHQPLKFESSRNITIIAKDRRRQVSNILSLGESGLLSIGNSFSVRDRSGNVLLHIDPREMVIGANHMVVAESGGLRLDGYLQTQLIRGGPTKDLRLDAPIKSVRVESKKDLKIESPAGAITGISFDHIKLKSTGGAVTIESNRLEMKNLGVSWGTPSRDKQHEPAYQVCMCENGRVFLAHRDGFCQIGESICKESNKVREEPSWSKPKPS